ncbi:uncharacterized protein LOC122076928 isoform X2 [Macadamia integrifolia]|uniref:uncharacterized protein LOC122076928 isoform X2 n=1 Tax=Macadamia integrifolia TaxID=60698 RepID=UPI001C4F02C7|nr:uncharacterized protein LOC122076928 isoform X2 [Macadamia integrifolia]
MVYKRPFGDEESYELAFKHPRRLDYSRQLFSFVEAVPCNDIPQDPQASGEGEGEAEAEAAFSKAQGFERIVSSTTTEECTGADKEVVSPAPLGISGLSWVTSNTSEENSRPETAARASFSPDFSEPDYAARVMGQSDEIYSLLLGYPPRKPVPVGPDHQADVPAWGIWGVKKASSYLDEPDPVSLNQASSSDILMDDDNGEKMMGTCIIPMHDSEPSSYSGDEFGSGRADCTCLDGGSIRCVRQHVKEARERLKGTLGQERFVGLGFCEMGEEVAQRWSEEEERVFLQVVFSNPVSLCKNFWDHLSVVFPSRTRKDLVSYYFNVFMLRKRAEQNRTIPLNIDSDNDEWQESDDGEEFGTTEDCEDSVVESLVDQEDPGYKQEDHEKYFNDDDEDGEEMYDDDDDDDDDDLEGAEGSAGEEDGNVSEAYIEKLPDGCSFNPAVKLGVTHPHDGGEDNDVQDDSCTSYECQHSGADSSGPVDAGVIMQESRPESSGNKVLQSTYDGLSSGAEHGYCLEPCDAKVWDIGYLTGPKNDADFLPTCSMIEEVFGEEAWNNNKGIS